MNALTIGNLRKLIEGLADEAEVVLWAGPAPEDQEDNQAQNCGAHVEFGVLHITQDRSI